MTFPAGTANGQRIYFPSRTDMGVRRVVQLSMETTNDGNIMGSRCFISLVDANNVVLLDSYPTALLRGDPFGEGWIVGRVFDRLPVCWEASYFWTQNIAVLSGRQTRLMVAYE